MVARECWSIAGQVYGGTDSYSKGKSVPGTRFTPLHVLLPDCPVRYTLDRLVYENVKIEVHVRLE